MSEHAGRIVAGKKVYIITHAYYHFLCEIVEMLGPQRALVKNVRFIYSCTRDWTDFFKDGCRDDTTYRIFPDGEVSWFDAFVWNHEIPG